MFLEDSDGGFNFQIFLDDFLVVRATLQGIPGGDKISHLIKYFKGSELW
jgi:hypothetical protein